MGNTGDEWLFPIRTTLIRTAKKVKGSEGWIRLDELRDGGNDASGTAN